MCAHEVLLPVNVRTSGVVGSLAQILFDHGVLQANCEHISLLGNLFCLYLLLQMRLFAGQNSQHKNT